MRSEFLKPPRSVPGCSLGSRQSACIRGGCAQLTALVCCVSPCCRGTNSRKEELHVLLLQCHKVMQKAVFCISGIKKGTAQQLLRKHFCSPPPLNTHLCPPCCCSCCWAVKTSLLMKQSGLRLLLPPILIPLSMTPAAWLAVRRQ